MSSRFRHLECHVYETCAALENNKNWIFGSILRQFNIELVGSLHFLIPSMTSAQAWFCDILLCVVFKSGSDPAGFLCCDHQEPSGTGAKCVSVAGVISSLQMSETLRTVFFFMLTLYSHLRCFRSSAHTRPNVTSVPSKE